MRGADSDQDGMLKRREIASLTKFQFLLHVAGKIMMSSKLNRGTEGSVTLNQHLTRRLTTASASGHLSKQLKCAFAGAKIGQV